MDFENTVAVGSFANQETAEAAVSLLRSEGVEAVIGGAAGGGEIPSLELAGGVKVYVQAEQAEFAAALLEQGADGPTASD